MPHGAGILGNNQGRPILTKKTQMEVKQYIQLGMKKVIRKFWYAFLVPPAIIIPGFIWTGALVWLIVGALLVTILYFLFWYVQFYGLSIAPQGKALFERQLFAITPDFVGMMKSETDPQGMMIPWDKVTQVDRTDKEYVLHLTLAHMVIIPFEVFKSQQDQNFTEAILRRRNLLPGKVEG